MGKIQDLPIVEKPREKAERFGIESLKDEELLALIISSGTVGHSSLDIEKEILLDSKNLSSLIYKPMLYFYDFKGLKRAKVIKIMAVLEIAKRIKEKELLTLEENNSVTSETLYQRYRFRLASSTQEELIIIILNKNKNVIYEKILYHGDDNSIPINYRDILRLLMIHNGYYFYLVHNHPNGSFFPSEADESLTKKIIEKARNLGVTLLDHIIISQSGYYSFLHENLLKQFKKEENI